MSLNAKIVVSVLLAMRRSGIMGKPGKDMKKEVEKAKRFNSRHCYVQPKGLLAEYETDWTKAWPCLLIRNKTKSDDRKVILYLHGGGDRDQWKPEVAFARTYGKRTGRTVIYPVYPPFSEASLADTAAYIYSVYRDIASVHGNKHITVIGGSYGGFLALQLISQINRDQEGVRMPDLMILNSPFAFPKEDADWKRVMELERFDAMIPEGGLRYMCDMVDYLGDRSPDEIRYVQNMDFRDAPKTYVFYTQEACAAAEEPIRDAYKRCGAENRLFVHFEPGMMHCYACAPVFPESRRDFKKQVATINGEVTAQAHGFFR